MDYAWAAVCGNKEADQDSAPLHHPIHGIPTWTQAPKGTSQDPPAFVFWPHGNDLVSFWHGAAEHVQADVIAF